MWIISAIIGGLIIGALARLVLPGKQNISMLVTIILGMLGSLIGSAVAVYVFKYGNDNGGFAIIPFLLGVVVAAVLIVIYGKVMAGRSGPA